MSGEFVKEVSGPGVVSLGKYAMCVFFITYRRKDPNVPVEF